MKTPVVVEQQVSEARRFWRNRQIRTALIVPWAEAYTGAFIMPVFAYFMQGLGLQATEMGMLRATQLVLNAATERFGMLRFRVEISLCVIGCGFGVLMLLLAKDVMSYETTSTAAGDDATRSIVGANGKAEDDEEALDPTECAPVCRAASESGRDVGGVDGGKGGQLSAEPPPSPATPLSGSAASTSPPATGVTDLDGGGSWWALICPCALGKEGRPPAVLVFAFVGLFFASTFRDLQRISWPLFIKAHFGWSEREYGLLLPLTQGAAFCLAATHWLHERIGSSAAMGLLGGGSALAYAVTFTLQESVPLVRGAHVVCALFADVSNSAFELILVAVASTYVPPEAQGRLFALLAIMRYAGNITGNLAGAYLYQLSASWDSAPSIFGGGALPTTLAAVPALINAAALAHALRKSNAASAGGTTLAAGGGSTSGTSYGTSTDDELV